MGNDEENRAAPAKRSKLPLGIKLSFGIGDISNNIFIVTTGMYLLFFMTNVVGINPALAGAMLLFPKLWDVVSDPTMGAISDVTHSRFGRRRVYLLYGAAPFGICFFILFLIPGFQTEFANALQISLLFALGCTAFTVVNVPYASMVPEMSDDYNERLSIVSFRMFFASIGALLAGGLTMTLVTAGGGGADGFRYMGGIFGLAIIVSCLWCFFGTRKAPSLPPHKETPPIKEQIKIAARNYPFTVLMASYFLQALAIGVMMAGFVYYVKYAMAARDGNEYRLPHLHGDRRHFHTGLAGRGQKAGQDKVVLYRPGHIYRLDGLALFHQRFPAIDLLCPGVHSRDRLLQLPAFPLLHAARHD